jgi:hypothetical protein
MKMDGMSVAPTLKLEYIEVQRKGQNVRVPSCRIGPRTITCAGGWLKIASVMDEEWLEEGDADRPELMISEVARSPLRADILTFTQRFDEQTPRLPYTFDWDNAAVVPTTSFAKWWDGLPQVSRKNVRRAARKGVVIKQVSFTDDLVNGIREIYNADPVRQTGRFWHYGKSLESVKKENATYLHRSCLLGAYVGDELVGFIKMVYVGGSARLMQVVAKYQHQDKRPMNALIAKAVEICEREKAAYLVYGKYSYGNKTQSSLMEFKRRNGFERMNFPRYFVPLTIKGRLALRLHLHRGLLGVLPQSVITVLVQSRRRMLQLFAPS